MRLHIYLPDDLGEALRDHVKKAPNGTSLSDVVRKAIKAYLPKDHPITQYAREQAANEIRRAIGNGTDPEIDKDFDFGA